MSRPREGRACRVPGRDALVASWGGTRLSRSREGRACRVLGRDALVAFQGGTSAALPFVAPMPIYGEGCFHGRFLMTAREGLGHDKRDPPGSTLAFEFSRLAHNLSQKHKLLYILT